MLSEGDNVTQIARSITELDDGDQLDIINSAYGGGNPAHIFLIKLQSTQPNLLISEFYEALEENVLKRAKEQLKVYKETQKLREINHIDCKKLSYIIIDPIGKDVSGWEKCALNLGFNKLDISRINTARNHPGQYCQLDALTKIISMRLPNFTINQFLNILKECKINHAHKLMLEKIQK